MRFPNLSLRLFLALSSTGFLFTHLACSESSAPQGPPSVSTAVDGGPAPIDASPSYDASPGYDATEREPDASIGEPTPVRDPFKADPPAGSILCGKGTLTQDKMEDCSGWGGSTPALCKGSVAVADATWEVWCSPAQTYLFIKVPDLKKGEALGAFCRGDAGGGPLDAALTGAWVRGLGHVGTVPLLGPDAFGTLSAGKGIHVATEAYLPSFSTGTATFFFEAQCQSQQNQKVIVLGARLQWGTTDGGP